MSIALATSLSAIFNFIYLINKFQYKIFDRKMNILLLKIFFCNVLSFIFVLIVGNVIFKEPTFSVLLKKEVTFSFARGFTSQFNIFALLSVLYLGVLCISAYIIKAKDILEIIKTKKSR
jgi:hypothetical protein